MVEAPSSSGVEKSSSLKNLKDGSRGDSPTGKPPSQLNKNPSQKAENMTPLNTKKAAGEEQMEDESVAAAATVAPIQKLVTADGTYATQSAFSGDKGDSSGFVGSGRKDREKDRPPMRKYLMEGDFFVAASMASSLTKLAMRYNKALHDQTGVVEDPAIMKKVL